MSYLVYFLAIPWFNSAVYIYLRDTIKSEAFADASVLIGYSLLIVVMFATCKVTPNTKSFKKDIKKEFFSHHNLLKSAVIYVISIAFLSSNNPSFGTALLIPYYMFVINFYTSISSGEIKEGWF